MSGEGTDRSRLPFSPASERNREPIRRALEPRMPRQGRVLEIGAGTGQHAVYLARAFTGLDWLPTDIESQLTGLRARIDAEGPENLQQPVALDVREPAWPDGPFEAAYSANTAHIMHWDDVCAMFEGVGDRLSPGAPFFLYGPFNVDGDCTAPSNEAFDRDLRARDSGMGLRDAVDLETLAKRHGMALEECLEMPANNFILVFRADRPHNGAHEHR